MFKLSQKGFSFIEIIVVLAIVSIIAILGTGFYSRFLTQNSVTNTTDHMISQLRRAQLYKMMGKQNAGSFGVKYSETPTKQVTYYLSGNASFDENYKINDNITITPTTFDINFTQISGVPTGATFPFTITIVGNNSSESITINS